MREWLRDHGLLVANLALFLIFFGGMVLSGVRRRRRPCNRRRQGLQRSRTGTWRPRRHGIAVSRHFAVLVRVVPELAERVSRRRSDRLGIGLPSATGNA